MTDNFVDLLDRKRLAENFTDVATKQDAKVYSINAPWGAGKTWFLKYIKKSFKTRKLPFIQFNIWENDYLNNPFQSVIAEIINLLEFLEIESFSSTEAKKYKEEINKLKKSTNKFMDFLNRIGVNGNISIPIPEVNGTITSVGVQLSPAKIDEYNKMKKAKEELISELFQIVNQIPAEKIIVAIDELDRCRPDYTIQVLEIIKHFFDIDKLTFIIAVDKKQLINTVKVLYGLNTDVDCYLKKFVDIEYTLPEPDIKKFVEYLFETKYSDINSQVRKFSDEQKVLLKSDDNVWVIDLPRDEQYWVNALIEVAKDFSLKLRDIEKLALKLSIILERFGNDDVLQFAFLCNLLILNVQYPETYKKIKTETLASNHGLKGIAGHTVEIINIINSKQTYNNPDMDRKSNILHCKNQLKSYFVKIDFAENFSKT